MTVFKVVAVKDELTNNFLQPTFIESIEESERLFAYQINTIGLWKENPEDYSLYHIGSYDQETGSIIGINPVKIVGGRAVKKQEVNNDIHVVK